MTEFVSARRSTCLGDEQRPVITADRRFYNVVREHPYLAGQMVMLESLA